MDETDHLMMGLSMNSENPFRARSPNRVDSPVALLDDRQPGATEIQGEDDEWIDEVPRDDAYTTFEQDEAYELSRWASWTRPASEVTNVMFQDSSWNIEVPLPEYRLNDEQFFALPEFHRDNSIISTDEDTEGDDAEGVGEDPYERRQRMKLLSREFWRRSDRDWCFACHYGILLDQRRTVPAFNSIQTLLESNFHVQTLNTLCSTVQDVYQREVRFSGLPDRGKDVFTDDLLPQRYWHRRSIRDHLLHHVTSVQFDIEQTFRELTELAQTTRRTLFKRHRTRGSIKANNGAVLSYLRVCAEKQRLWKYVYKARQQHAKNKR